MHIVAIDQGTTSTRAIVFDDAGTIVATGQREHEQIFPRAGWVEHDAAEIWSNTTAVIDEALEAAGIDAADVAGIGITNQRETAIVWDRATGEPICNAIVWQDTRTQPLIDELAAESVASPASRACRWRPTSRRPRSPGSSTTSTAPASGPRTAS
jgi:glycerol kinase